MRLLLLLTLLLATLSAEARTWSLGVFRMHVGDDPAFSARDYDDSAWKPVEFWRVPAKDDVVWLRRRVTVYPQLERPVGLYVGALASHELWWDGVRIGGAGVPGRTKEEEVPGPIEVHYHLPDALATPGEHTLAIRTSAFHRHFDPFTGYWSVLIGPYEDIVTARRADAQLALIALSAILLTGIFAFAMYLINRRDRAFLLLSTLCLAAAGLLIAESWRQLFGYTYDRHIIRLVFVVALSWLTGVQLVALVVTRFPHRFGRHFLLLAVIAASIPPFAFHGWDPKSMFLFMICVSMALAWTIFAAVRRLPGSVLALIGVGVTAVLFSIEPWRFLDRSVYFALDVLFACLLLSHALEVRRERHERAEALLKSARLELEVLKRHLQPHFLMNTLTALAEWVEQDPKTAVRMIDSIAEEYRILTDIAERRLIPIDEELRLCRSHLANMSLRKDVQYALEVDGVQQTDVPPAVFHTLVENAVTHAPAGLAQVTMRLSAREDGKRVVYRFESPAGEGEGKPGTGTKYIEARLREAWGEAWTFSQKRNGATWEAEIVMPAGAAA